MWERQGSFFTGLIYALRIKQNKALVDTANHDMLGAT